MLTDKEKLEQHLKKFKYVTAEVRQKILERVNKTPVESTISQSEKQQLLSILREELKDCEETKELLKGYSSTLWGSSIKGTPAGEEAFKQFSKVHSSAKEFKKKTVKIANLIKKVKAL